MAMPEEIERPMASIMFVIFMLITKIKFKKLEAMGVTSVNEYLFNQ